MTPDEKKLYALMAVAEQQQNLVNQAVKLHCFLLLSF